jgi:hypothetical protein
MERSVFIVEAEDPGSAWLTGRFDGTLEGTTRVLDSFEDLSLEEALAWARERAERVLIRYGDDPDVHYSAGTDHPPGVPRWPPPGLPPLVARRHPGDRWRDRVETDDPIGWRVDVTLVPPDTGDPRELRDAWAAEAARVAEAAGATWDAEPLDTFIADLDATQRRGGGGWFTYGGPNFHLELAVEAATAGQATAEAARRLTMPPGWRYEATAEPAP